MVLILLLYELYFGEIKAGFGTYLGDIQGVPKKGVCLLDISATKYWIVKLFFSLLKTEIHMQILNTETFLSHLGG